MEKRGLIVDISGLGRKYHAINTGETAVISMNGQLVKVDTKIQSGIIKSIHRWSKFGYFPTVVCGDRSVPSRRQYFKQTFENDPNVECEYKKSRGGSVGSEYFDAINMTMGILAKGGVKCIKGDNYEADDLIFASVQALKQQYPGMPIDIVTNDSDMIPLVDEQVSVFYQSKKGTYAINKEIEKTKYIQLTPDNYQGVVEDLSAFSKFSLPYNTVLLHKLLRGDKSDEFKNKVVSRMFPATKFNALIEEMYWDGVDLGNVFRYGINERVITVRNTGQRISYSEVANYDKKDLRVDYIPPKELGTMMDVLSHYIKDAYVLDYVQKAYIGMNLNQPYTDVGDVSRHSVSISSPIEGYSATQLKNAADDLKIRLPY